MSINGQHILVDQDITYLSLCVLPKDHFVPKTYPLGIIKIYIEQAKIEGVKNYSGYYTFTNLKEDIYTIRVESEYYLTKEFDVIIPSYGSPPNGIIYSDEDIQLQDYNGIIIATIDLRPNPLYSFPAGSNLIRGIVYDAESNPLPDTIVKVEGKPIYTRTTQKGEFVLYFTNLTQYDIVKINDKNFVLGNGTHEINIFAEHRDLGSSPPVSLNLEEGKTTFEKIFY